MHHYDIPNNLAKGIWANQSIEEMGMYMELAEARSNQVYFEQIYRFEQKDSFGKFQSTFETDLKNSFHLDCYKNSLYIGTSLSLLFGILSAV